MSSGERCSLGHPRRLAPCAKALRQRGFGYLMVLFAMAAMGITLAGAGEVWRTASLREKEAQLLFVGQQFRLALASYRDRSPAGSPDAPATLDDLLQDPRFPTPVAHLRRLWRDPMTNSSDWVLVRAGGRIRGIHTGHEGEPLRNAHTPQDAALNGTASYRQWVFEAAPAAASGANPANAPPDTNINSGGVS